MVEEYRPRTQAQIIEQLAKLQERHTYNLERIESLLERIEKLETAQEKFTTMVNRGLGAFAFVVGVGVFVGWVFSVGSNVREWMSR